MQPKMMEHSLMQHYSNLRCNFTSKQYFVCHFGEEFLAYYYYKDKPFVNDNINDNNNHNYRKQLINSLTTTRFGTLMTLGLEVT